MAYTITWQTQGVLWTFYGVLTNDDAIQANLDIYGDSRFDELRYQIVDISGVDRFDVSPDAMEETAAMDEVASNNNPHLIVAVIASKDEALEVAQLYASAMQDSPWKVEMFNSKKDAEKWINSFL